MTDQDAALTELRYTRDDHVAGYQLHGVPTRRMWLVVALVFFAMGAIAYMLDGVPAALSVALGGIIGGIVFGLFGWAVYLPFVARRTFARQPLAQLRVRIGFRPEGIRSESERGASTILWKDFIQWRADRKVVLLYLSPRLFLIVPARLAALGFPIDRLRETLRREFGPPRR
jgi:hypothetical protein